MDFIRKNRELQRQLSFLEKNRNFISKGKNNKNLKSTFDNNFNNQNPKKNQNEFNFQIHISNNLEPNGQSNNQIYESQQNPQIETEEKNEDFDENSFMKNMKNLLNTNQINSGIDLKAIKEKKILEKIKSNNLFGLNYLEFILKDKYKFAKNIECNRYNCFSPNICFDGKFCKCGEEYANYFEGETNGFNNLSRDFIFCGYKNTNKK